jgi:CARDB
MTRGSPVARLAVGFALLALVLGASVGAIPTARGAAPGVPVTGQVTGPNVVATGGQVHLTINGTGGPAFAANGTLVGNLTYYASIAGTDTSTVSITPATGTITPGHPATATLAAGTIVQVLTVTVLLASVYKTENVSTNLTYTLPVVQPYVLSATIVNAGTTTVLAFPVVVDLDGSPVGSVTVPTLSPGVDYNLSFRYATLGLSSGSHTFTISLESAHGLVTFSNGAVAYSQTFYVAGAATDYTVWYVVGAVAFIGVLFIFMTRVAARRRGALRK